MGQRSVLKGGIDSSLDMHLNDAWYSSFRAHWHACEDTLHAFRGVSCCFANGDVASKQVEQVVEACSLLHAVPFDVLSQL